jgi:hypothetical protein
VMFVGRIVLAAAAPLAESTRTVCLPEALTPHAFFVCGSPRSGGRQLGQDAKEVSVSDSGLSS